MRTEYLREFLAAASAGSFTAAAKRLYMSQPKMSMHIAAMESELGFALFDRTGGLSLTREGELFYEQVSELIDSYDGLVQRCRDLAKTSLSRLVFGEFSMADMFPPRSLSRFRRVCAELSADERFEVVTRPLDNSRTIAESFEAGLCDASFRTCCMEQAASEVVELDDGMSVLPLEMDPMVALVRPGHPLLACGYVTPADVAAYPVMLSSLPSMETYNSTRRDFFAAHGCRPRYRTRSAGTPAALVKPGTGSDEVTLVATSYSGSSSLVASRDAEIVEISDTHAQSCFCLCFPTHTHNKAVLALVDAMRG